MAQDVLDMSAFKGQKPSQAFAAIGQQESLAEGIGSSYGILGYKGKVWTLRLRGEKHTFTRADDGSPSNYIDVIILKQARHKSKSYYEKYDPAGGSEGQRPICSSLDGIVPDADAAQKQSNACAVCPRNVWKTSADGMKTRECTDYKRLAVMLLPSVSAGMLGKALMEPVFLRVPPASLNNLAIYGETLSGQGWPYYAVVTRVSFDPEQPHPKMIFRPLQALTDAEAPVVLPLRDDMNTLRITGDDKVAGVSHPALAAPQQQAPALAPPPAQLAPAPAQVQVMPPAAPAATAAPAQEQPVNTGFLELKANPPAAATATAAAPAPQTAADIGEPTEADEAMNARIAALLKTA